MNIKIKTTLGVNCKACNRALDEMSFEQELCSTCLGVVHEMNKDLYKDVEETTDA